MGSAAKNMHTEQLRALAHDLKSPLSYLRLLVNREQGDGGRSGLETVLSRLSNIARALQDLSEENSAAVQTLRGPELCEILRNTVMGFELECGQSELGIRGRVAFEVEVDPGARAMSFSLSPEIFARSLTNFIHNSIEAGATRVSVRAQLTHQTLLLQIQDNGTGIERDTLVCLGRVPVPSKKDKGEGIGVLTSVRALASCGVDVQFFSDPPHGTLVTLHIPLVR